ncbi:hypothetical protein JXM67_14965 [candidate division WOR-3 bacterium]|nr:hypothetical protein [candidate division WOR-3 bacterium]
MERRPEDLEGTQSERGSVRIRHGLKRRPNALFNFNPWFSIAGLLFIYVTIRIVEYFCYYPGDMWQYFQSGTESGIFVKYVDSKELLDWVRNPDIEMIRVVPKEGFPRLREHECRLFWVTFVMNGRRLTFEQLEGVIKEIVESKGDRGYLIVLEDRTPEWLSHGDFVAICDILRTNDARLIAVAVK